LVGGGADPMFPPDHVIIWDDAKEEIVKDIIFESDVLNLIFTDDRYSITIFS
jgi:hypothetical protein